MTMRRGEAVGIVTDDDRPWVLGGKLAHNNATTTTEMWNKTGSEIFWTEGEPLDIVKMSHCGAANENGRKVIITGTNKTRQASSMIHLAIPSSVYYY